MEQCSFQINQKSRNTQTQTPEHSVSITLQDDALYVNLCPSVLTSVIFLATDMLAQLTPTDDIESKPKSGMSYRKERNLRDIADKSKNIHSGSPIVITNEYGRDIKVWWKIESTDKVSNALKRSHLFIGRCNCIKRLQQPCASSSIQRYTSVPKKGTITNSQGLRNRSTNICVFR